MGGIWVKLQAATVRLISESSNELFALGKALSTVKIEWFTFSTTQRMIEWKFHWICISGGIKMLIKIYTKMHFIQIDSRGAVVAA